MDTEKFYFLVSMKHGILVNKANRAPARFKELENAKAAARQSEGIVAIMECNPVWVIDNDNKVEGVAL